MKKIGWIASCCTCLFILSACSSVNSITPFDDKQTQFLLQELNSVKPAAQAIALQLPKGIPWKKINAHAGEAGTQLMMIPDNQSEHQFTESLQTRISSYDIVRGISAGSMVESDIALISKQCKQAKSTILSKQTQTVTYQLSLSQCGSRNDLTVIGKAFNGRDGVYLVRYVANTEQVDQRRIAVMSQVIQTAELRSASLLFTDRH